MRLFWDAVMCRIEATVCVFFVVVVGAKANLIFSFPWAGVKPLLPAEEVTRTNA